MSKDMTLPTTIGSVVEAYDSHDRRVRNWLLTDHGWVSGKAHDDGQDLVVLAVLFEAAGGE